MFKTSRSVIWKVVVLGGTLGSALALSGCGGGEQGDEPRAWAAQVNTLAIEALPGATVNTLARNDDGSTGNVPIGFSLNFFGVTRSSLWVNNNGNVTFDASLSTYTPFNIYTARRQIIAPFFADVDTRNTSNPLSVPVTYGQATFNGHPTFYVNWAGVNAEGVGYYASLADKLNRFQLLLVNRADTGNPENFDIYFNYDQILWETGQASGGVNGFGGSPARAGYSNGVSTNSYELRAPASSARSSTATPPRA